MNNKILTFSICLLLLLTIFFSGCITEEDKKTEPEDPIVLKDAPTKLNDTDQNQEIAFIELKYGDKLKWSDLKFQISKDGATYYIIDFNTPQPNLNIICRKGIEKNDIYLWEPGETIWFYEDGADYEPGTYFYCKIIHNPSRAPPLLDSYVKVY